MNSHKPLRVPATLAQSLYKAHVQLLSRVRLFATPWTVARQAPLSMGFSKQEYWGGFPFPSPGDLPEQGIQLTSLASPALAGGLFATREAPQSL